MTRIDESRRHIRQLRARADKLVADAERAANAAERARLLQKARQLVSDSDQESMMAAGDIYPAR